MGLAVNGQTARNAVHLTGDEGRFEIQVKHRHFVVLLYHTLAGGPANANAYARVLRLITPALHQHQIGHSTHRREPVPTHSATMACCEEGVCSLTGV